MSQEAVVELSVLANLSVKRKYIDRLLHSAGVAAMQSPTKEAIRAKKEWRYILTPLRTSNEEGIKMISHVRIGDILSSPSS